MSPYNNVTLPEDRQTEYEMNKSGSKLVATDLGAHRANTAPDARKAETAAKNAGIDCKPDYSLIPESFMDQLAYVLMAGQLKYKRDNYRKGHTSNQLTSAAGRHLKKIDSGEDIDTDTTARLRDGCTDIDGVFHEGFGDKSKQIYHWACVGACALKAIEQIRLGTHIDDRYKEKK